MTERTRRRWLQVMSSAGVAGLAGCSLFEVDSGSESDGDDGSSPTDSPGDSTETADTETATTDDTDETEETPEEPDPAENRAEPGERSECEPQVISSDIGQDTTWAVEDCPRVALDGNIKVQNGATLTIEPGVEVVGRAGAKLTIKSNGTLQANGEPGNPVWFYGASNVPAYWQTIEIESNRQNQLTNVVVEDAGGADWANVWMQDGARLSVSNSAFLGSETWGMVAENGATLPTFSNNGFSENGTAPIRVGATVVGMLDSTSNYVGGNGDDHIEVNNADVESEATWPATDAPYFFKNNTKLFAPITIDPGAQFTFQSGGKLTVKSSGGSLTADASDGDPITFEGATATPGYWQTIEFESNNPNNVLNNVEVAHGGGGDWANVWVQDDARLSVQNATFAESDTYGLVVENGATLPEFATNTFSNNGTAPLRVSATVVGMLDSGSTYVGGNGNDHIEVNNADVEDEATWPATDAPYFFKNNTKLFTPITIDPGAQFTFQDGGKLTVKSNGGALTADAGGGETISFVGASATPGYWQTIEIESNTPDNVFNNVEVAHGGGGDWANIWIQDDAQATVQNSLIRESATFGIVAESGSVFNGSNNTYQNNASGGIDQR